MSELYLDNIERYDYSGSGVYQNPLDPLVPPILLNTASVNNPIILNSDGRDTLQLTQDFYFKALNGGNRSFLWSQLCNDYCSSIMGGAGADIPVFIQGIMKLECTPMISPLYYLFRNLKLNWANIIDNKPTNGDIYTIEHIFSSVSDNLKIS